MTMRVTPPARPLESLVSKWYGEAEQRLAAVFDCCAELGSTVIFLDEIDSLAPSRDADSGMHEATRRSLSVLLRKGTPHCVLRAPRAAARLASPPAGTLEAEPQSTNATLYSSCPHGPLRPPFPSRWSAGRLDGFDANQSTVLVAATNRPQGACGRGACGRGACGRGARRLRGARRARRRRRRQQLAFPRSLPYALDLYAQILTPRCSVVSRSLSTSPCRMRPHGRLS